MIEGFIGRPGAGKTYIMTKRILKMAEGGRPVYSNYWIDHVNVQPFSPDDLMTLPPGIVVLDEAHLYFPARGAMKLPMSWLGMMSQTRKKGWDIYWTCQHERRVDSVLKDVTNLMWLVRSWGFLGNGPQWFQARCYEPEDFRRPKKSLFTTYSRFSAQHVGNKYDTFESISEATHLVTDDVYRKAARERLGNG